MKASHTKATSFRRCRRQYHWSYDLHRDAGRSTGQIVGTIGHAVLAHYYLHKGKEGVGRECIQKVESLGLRYDLEYEDIARLERAVSRYVEFADDYDTIDVISVEQHITKELGKHTIEGYVDLLATLPDGRKICVDHKFQKRPDVNGIETDNQLTMYLWLTGADAGMLNAINVTTSKTTKMASVIRDITVRTAEHLKLFELDLEAQLDEMAEFDSHPEKERFAYPSFVPECSWNCNFFSACKEFQKTGDIRIVENLPPRIFDRVEATIGEQTE